ncbi:hypothetical protein PPSIR1_31293 [Plesiocystis pacifica SIR-1]|uniref:Uncharacterized protein n=1 Tax=Plesiocystis pacifica SIR-1 TaxID=391625 RepID=A6GDC1_9BACT|nr:hypothetical protein [Plesiocystis pacifica]EDM76112.1 hypothetical protein PPSIR1_31293 [Plesiocystis pacifica SIR-1]
MSDGPVELEIPLAGATEDHDARRQVLGMHRGRRWALSVLIVILGWVGLNRGAKWQLERAQERLNACDREWKRQCERAVPRLARVMPRTANESTDLHETFVYAKRRWALREAVAGEFDPEFRDIHAQELLAMSVGYTPGVERYGPPTELLLRYGAIDHAVMHALNRGDAGYFAPDAPIDELRGAVLVQGRRFTIERVMDTRDPTTEEDVDDVLRRAVWRCLYDKAPRGVDMLRRKAEDADSPLDQRRLAIAATACSRRGAAEGLIEDGAPDPVLHGWLLARAAAQGEVDAWWAYVSHPQLSNNRPLLAQALNQPEVDEDALRRWFLDHGSRSYSLDVGRAARGAWSFGGSGPGARDMLYGPKAMLGAATDLVARAEVLKLEAQDPKLAKREPELVDEHLEVSAWMRQEAALMAAEATVELTRRGEYEDAMRGAKFVSEQLPPRLAWLGPGLRLLAASTLDPLLRKPVMVEIAADARALDAPSEAAVAPAVFRPSLREVEIQALALAGQTRAAYERARTLQLELSDVDDELLPEHRKVVQLWIDVLALELGEPIDLEREDGTVSLLRPIDTPSGLPSTNEIFSSTTHPELAMRVLAASSHRDPIHDGVPPAVAPPAAKASDTGDTGGSDESGTGGTDTDSGETDSDSGETDSDSGETDSDSTDASGGDSDTGAEAPAPAPETPAPEPRPWVDMWLDCFISYQLRTPDRTLLRARAETARWAQDEEAEDAWIERERTLLDLAAHLGEDGWLLLELTGV